jgi:hypothetical protein
MERSAIPASSAKQTYVSGGLLSADWAGDVEEPMMDFGERQG